MDNESKTKVFHKKIIIIIAAIAIAAVICLLFVFKPWERTDASSVVYDETQQSSETLSALADPDAHTGEEISFTAEAISDSVNYEGMLVVNAVADNEYVVVINYLDRENQMHINMGDKISVIGFITGISLIETEEGNPLSGVEIAANSLELSY